MNSFFQFDALRLGRSLPRMAKAAGLVGLCILASTSAQALPSEVLAALAQAGVPKEAMSVLVTAIPGTGQAAPLGGTDSLANQGTPSGADAASVSHSLSGTTATPSSASSTLSATPTASLPRLSHRADASVNPASVMKLITTYAALSTLGANYTWKNRIYIDGSLAPGGVLQGNLIIRGSGDPKLVLERIEELFAQVQAKGVREVRGDIILDRSIFQVPDKNPADFDDEPLRPYNAVPDGLLVNFKSLIFTFTPDEAGQRVRIKSEPPMADVVIPTELPLSGGICGDWHSHLKADFFTPTKISFAGRYPASCGEKMWSVAYSAPRDYAGRVIHAMWLASGGTLTGKVREEATPKGARALLTAPSLPLSIIIADVNKFSNNVMAQQVFLTLSAQGKRASFEASKRLLAAWWKKTLPSFSAPIIENGSGLSRRERTSAQALTGLLLHAATSPNAEVFANSLSIAGVDGTVVGMRNRNPNSEALGNAQLKTGTLNGVAAVAGYATGRSGQRYCIVAIINHPQAPSARAALDKLVEWTIKDEK
jgi:serine-type D-Ala-D-Ala carboxypeptidase/endopeptidase (penicillin-binding protein 4)